MLSFADVGLAALDALAGVDAGCIFVFEDERPLRGMAGYVDWRLCGALSRILFEGRFTGADGDALLFPVRGRFVPERVFCFGLGTQDAFTRAALARGAREACQALHRAGARGVAVQPPPVAGLDEVKRARLFVTEGAPAFQGERMVLFGDSRALAKGFHDSAPIAGVELDRGSVAPIKSGPSSPQSKTVRAG